LPQIAGRKQGGDRLAKVVLAADDIELEGFENPTAELRARVFDRLRAQTDERLAAVDAESGKVLRQRVAPRVAVQSLAMADSKVVYHNYEELVALDPKTGEPVWTYPCPVTERLRFGVRNMLGNLLLSVGKVLWASTTAGGGVCLELSDGKVLWKIKLIKRRLAESLHLSLLRSTISVQPARI